MPEYLKRPAHLPGEDAAAIRATVSAIIEAVGREGADAVRRYSRELDGWDPPTFRVDRAAIDSAVAGMDPELRRHLGEKGCRRAAALFNWDRIAEQYEAVLTRAAGAR